MRVGLVLGAGGLPGEAFHRGVLAALHTAHGIDAREVDVVVGTSAGSLVAATLRAQGHPAPPPEADAVLVAEAAAMVDVRALAGYALRPWRMRPGALLAALLPAGTRPTSVLADPLQRRFGASWPERSTWVVAVRRRDGGRVVFGRDRTDVDLGTAVAASCAIPGYFAPVVLDGEAHVDGAVHSPTNADLLADLALDLVVVSAPMGVQPSALRPTLDLPARLVWHAQLVREVAVLRRAGSRVMVVEPGGDLLSALGVSPVNALRIDEVEELAYESARATSGPETSAA